MTTGKINLLVLWEQMLSRWVQSVADENPHSMSNQTYDSESWRDMGWTSTIFRGQIARIKECCGMPLPLGFEKALGVVLVRFSGEWGWSKAYVYPIETDNIVAGGLK